MAHSTRTDATLAVDGGAPVRSRMLPYGRQTVSDADVEAVVRVLRSDLLTTGPAVSAFEEAFADRVGVPHAVAVANGTAALHAAAFAVGVGPADEVVVPAITFAASANCALYLSASVRFADVRRDTLCVDPESVASLVGPRTRAIVSVDFAGCPADLEELGAIARQHGIALVDDAAHALGATYRGVPVAQRADAATFSLHPVKHITAGEGGVVVTSSAEIADRARRFRNHGIATDAAAREARATHRYEMVDLGYNYRLTDIQAALALSQLDRLDPWIARRRAIAGAYDAALGDLEEVERPARPADREHVWHLYVIRLRLERLRADRDQVFRAMRAEGIGVNVHYVPVPWHPYYQRLGHKRGSWPVAEAEYERMLTLPLWPGMDDRDIDDVVTALRKVCAAYRA